MASAPGRHLPGLRGARGVDAIADPDGYPLLVLALAEWALGPLGGRTLAAPGLPAEHPLLTLLAGRGARLLASDAAEVPSSSVHLLVTSAWLDSDERPSTAASQEAQHTTAAGWMAPGGVAIHHLPSRRFRLRTGALDRLGWRVLRGPLIDPPGPALARALAGPPRTRRRLMVRYHLGNLMVLSHA
jgi:hypothetical protein